MGYVEVYHRKICSVNRYLCKNSTKKKIFLAEMIRAGNFRLKQGEKEVIIMWQ